MGETDVTPAMIKAGLWHLMRFDASSSGDAEIIEILRDIYRIMRTIEIDPSAAERPDPYRG